MTSYIQIIGPAPKWKLNCICVCGKAFTAAKGNILSGNTKSCGCLLKAFTSNLNKSHNLSKTPIYKVFCTAKSRCNNPNSQFYRDYGGRGIKMLWPSFEAFYADMKPSYRPGLTLERLDVNGHYSKDNCSWVTRKAQANNRRNTPLITHNGITQSVSQWADHTGIKFATLYYRLHHGWSVEDALTYKGLNNV